jgi:hypothetical protein
VQIQERLRSTVWEARIAAGECLGHLAEHCTHHNAAELAQHLAPGVLSETATASAVKSEPDVEAPEVHDLSFRGFSADAVLSRGTLLLASGGKVLSGHDTLCSRHVLCCLTFDCGLIAVSASK